MVQLKVQYKECTMKSAGIFKCQYQFLLSLNNNIALGAIASDLEEYPLRLNTTDINIDQMQKNTVPLQTSKTPSTGMLLD